MACTFQSGLSRGKRDLSLGVNLRLSPCWARDLYEHRQWETVAHN